MSATDSTRTRILDAAREHFAAVGLAGARVDAIARAAGCNKQLIYHYFKDKAGLYEAVVRDVLAHNAPVSVLTQEQLAESLARMSEDEMPHRRNWLRMLAWEALSEDAGPLVAEDIRQEHLHQAMRSVETMQRAGVVDPRFSPRFVLLAVMSLVMLPLVLPQIARLITGLRTDSAEFRAQHAAMLREVARRLAPGAERVDG